MAPEHWEGKPGDARSDIYAFGCVLYEMLTGKRAAQERVPVEPPTIESIVRTCIEQDPEDRWQSARDLRRALSLPPTEDQRSASGLIRDCPVWLLAGAPAPAQGKGLPHACLLAARH